jgi:NAD(P)-dependent dehydrogenase (short-subunit alcohol dehydrogenase family)
VTCDVTSRESLQAAVAEIRKHTTFINVLVSNAGYLASTKFMKVPHEPGSAEDVAKFLWASEAEDKGVFDTNVESVYWLFTAFLTLLHAGNTEESSVYRQKEIDSQFIAVASLSGLLKKTLTGYMYNASKAACVHFAKGVSHDFAHLNIRANTICPGAFVTGMTDKFLPPSAEKRGGMPAETHPAGRTGTAEVGSLSTYGNFDANIAGRRWVNALLSFSSRCLHEWGCNQYRWRTFVDDSLGHLRSSWCGQGGALVCLGRQDFSH